VLFLFYNLVVTKRFKYFSLLPESLLSTKELAYPELLWKQVLFLYIKSQLL